MAEQPWQQQPGESDTAHNAFLAYLNLGKGKRTVVEAYRQTQRKPHAKQADGTWNLWVRKYRWEDRARDYDNWLQRQQDEAIAARAAREAAKWEARRQEALERGWETAIALHGQAQQMLKWPMQTQRTKRDGKTIIIKPARWSKDTMAKVMKLAVELEAAVLAAASKDPADLTDVEASATAEEPGADRTAAEGTGGQ